MAARNQTPEQPASVLLERIKAEKAAQANPKTQTTSQGGDMNDIVIFESDSQPVEVRLDALANELCERGEASELFARERSDGLTAILGNIEQTMFGEALYKTREERAAHLLYFVIKNHPFSDGNKRSGAFLIL
jgi:hypothetical protein